MKPSTIAFATLLSLAAFPLASARADDAPGGRVLKLLDQDGDGAVSRTEAQAMRERMFRKLDADGNGTVDEKEVAEARQRIADLATSAQSRLSIRFRRMDSDHSGGVTLAEFGQRMALFDLADRNGDGKLTADEIATVRELIGGPD